jgi:hypothetical protein
MSQDERNPRVGWDRDAVLAECVSLVRKRLPAGWRAYGYIDDGAKLVIVTYVARDEDAQRL